MNQQKHIKKYNFRIRKQYIDLEKISAKDTSEKVLKSKTYKDLLKCNNKEKKKKLD